MKKIQTKFILILIASPIVTWLIIFLINEATNNFSCLDRLSIGSMDAWIGFFGSIVGTLITVLTVVLTLDHNKDSEIKNVRPVVDLFPLESNTKEKATICYNYLASKNDSTYDYYDLNFSIEVLSDIPAKNFELRSFSLHFDDHIQTSILNHNEELMITTLIQPYNHGKISITPAHSGQIGINYMVAKNIFSNNDIFLHSSIIKFVFSYNDIFDNPSYLHEFSFIINISWNTELQKLEFFVFDSSNKFISEKEREHNYPDPI